MIKDSVIENNYSDHTCTDVFLHAQDLLVYWGVLWIPRSKV